MSRLARWTAVVALAVVPLASACGGGGDASPIVTGPPGTGVFTPATGAPPGSSAPGSSAPGSSTSTTVAGTTTTSGKPTITDASTLSTVGLDKVTFGMTVAEAEAALGSKLVAADSSNPACYSATPGAGPAGVTFLVADGRVERVDITEGKVTTRSGARIGSTEAEVTKLYGDQVQRQPRPDGQPGSWLVFVPKDEADAKYRIVFVSDGTTVTALRAGRLPQVLAAKGCT